MAKSKNATRVIISIIFIAYGVDGVVRALKKLLEFDLLGVVSCALGILMFITGIFGILKSQIKVCRALGVIVCILSAFNFILALAGGAFVTQMLVQALLAWIYFDCT